jgi:hypothetical protein
VLVGTHGWWFKSRPPVWLPLLLKLRLRLELIAPVDPRLARAASALHSSGP